MKAEKGVLELSWKLILIIVMTVAAFLVILVFTLNFSERLIDFFKNFKASNLIEVWKKILSGKE